MRAMMRILALAVLMGSLTFPGELRADEEDWLKIKPESHDFERVELGEGREKEFRLENRGPVNLLLGEPELKDAGEAFSIVENNCGSLLPRKRSCRITVEFAPDAPEPHRASLELNSALFSWTVPLQGEGVNLDEPAPQPQPDPQPEPQPEPEPMPDPPADTEPEPPLQETAPIQPEPEREPWELVWSGGMPETGSFSFEGVLVGESETETIRIVHQGPEPIALGHLGSSDPLEFPFALYYDGCSGQQLSPGESCSLMVSFDPVEEGGFQDRFTLVSEAGEDWVALTLSGQGTVVPGNRPPQNPLLLHPGSGEVNLKRDVLFRWEPCTDPDGDPVRYQLYYSSDPDFSGSRPLRVEPLAAKARLASMGLAGILGLLGLALKRRPFRVLLLAASLLALLLTACGEDVEENRTMRVSGLDAQTTYYWKVVSVDGRGGRTESDVESFSTR